MEYLRSLNFDGGSAANDSPGISQPRLTRSKASLKEVTIEELDLQFIPPDVTPDMYDPLQGDDDYTQFLAETFGVPAQAPGNNESAAGDADLLDLDPDFEYRETEDDPNQVGFKCRIRLSISGRAQYSTSQNVTF